MLMRPTIAVSSELIVRLAQARGETDRVFQTVQPAVLYERPIRERHRIIFYVGHLEAFDWNLLRSHLDLGKFNSEFDHLFAFGIDPIDGGLPGDRPSDWPTFNQVERYRQRIRTELDSALSEAAGSDELTQLLNIAIEHRLMHAETLEYMLHQLPYESKVRSFCGPLEVGARKPISNEMVRIPAGNVKLGLERSSGDFGWDNEFTGHTKSVGAFAIAKYKVSNGQFLQFLQDGGYAERSCWTEADWKWKSDEGIAHPVFWVKTESGFRYRSMFEEADLALDAPVYVSQAEASAYARWADKDLPTEAEWQRAAQGAGTPKATRRLGDPMSVADDAETPSEFGVHGLFGTGWEWTKTHFAPFAGFQAHPAYPGYSANFFDNQHFVMKGGSPRTAACMLRKTFRNWFQAHYQYAYAGFRCVSR